METQIRFRVDCKDNYWYFNKQEDAREFANHWRNSCNPVRVYRVIEKLDSNGYVINLDENQLGTYEERKS